MTRFHSFLKKKIEDQIAKNSAQLLAGSAKDYPQYQWYVGYMQAFTDTLNLCDEVEQDMGNERSGSAPGN